MWMIGIVILLLLLIGVLVKVKKKFTRILCCCGLCILFIGWISSVILIYSKEPIGQISGPEMDIVTINGCIYEADYDNDLSSNDRGHYIGKVMTDDAEVTFKIYSVKGTDDYIYRLWDWEGAFYKKVTSDR